MSPILLHIYGPIAIHSFGFMIVIGLLITLYLLHHDQPLQKLITHDQLTTLVQISFFAGLTGGRLWFLATNFQIFEHWTEFFSIWSGGLSILGAMAGILSTLTIYFSYKKLPILPILDRLALYAPLLQSISRFGCFFAGCCYGKVTDVPWAIMYQDPQSLAPLHIHLHPTQLYSALFLFCIFLLLLWFDQHKFTVNLQIGNKAHPKIIQKSIEKKPGFIMGLYLILASFERYSIDFLRGDQDQLITYGIIKNISIQQIAACSLIFIGIIIIKYTQPHQSYNNLTLIKAKLLKQNISKFLKR